MKKILILGGGFGAVSAAESLLKNLTSEHQITMVSRSPRFVFQPYLVDLAFGNHTIDDISHDLREAMKNRRIRFVQGEVARVDPYARQVKIVHGDLSGIQYDYLIFALGGRLATERIPGFFEHAHHPLTVEAALKFGQAIHSFNEGRAVIGSCEGARLEAAVYKTASMLSSHFEDRMRAGRTKITIVSPRRKADELEGSDIGRGFQQALDEKNIEVLTEFSVNRITKKSIQTSAGARIDYDLLMLLPPLVGPSALRGIGITDPDGFIRVNRNMRLEGVAGLYAVGDCVSLPGSKMSHMAVAQGEVAGANLAAEIESRISQAEYDHKTMLALDQAGQDSILNKQFWMNKVRVIEPRDSNKAVNKAKA